MKKQKQKSGIQKKPGKHGSKTAVVREYKDTIFRMLYSDKKELLALYNAVNGANYMDPEQLMVVTLEHAIYMPMKNDVSFILDTRLSLYEHQSTVCPNMPLREAVEAAVEECIEKGILREFLLREKAKVISMSIFEFDQELHDKTIRQESWEDGRIEGR
ncbi:MAG: transposase, partial [Lachnospiraceae bacterium]|nr:transposase [Lachnospiraceae bacterium]